MATTSKALNRYPRQGERIAPATLREFLLNLLPESFQAEPGRELRLCDVDETAWDRFSAEQIDELAGLVVDRVAAKRTGRAFQKCRPPRLVPGTRLEDLRLENRTHGRLADICQRLTGSSPKKLVYERQIQEAKWKLIYTTTAINAICDHLGFKDPANWDESWRVYASDPSFYPVASEQWFNFNRVRALEKAVKALEEKLAE